MIKKARVLAVVPARGQSKRCPRKNLKEYRGHPLIWWAVEAGKNSRYVDCVTVSSDDKEMLEYTRTLNVPVIPRPAHLATDTAANEDVMRHALTIFPDHDWVVLLQPTSPQRTADDIDELLEIMMRDGTAVGLTRRETPIPPHGFVNGAVYIMASYLLELGHNFQTTKPKSWLHMPDERSLDIDYAYHFEV